MVLLSSSLHKPLCFLRKPNPMLQHCTTGETTHLFIHKSWEWKLILVWTVNFCTLFSSQNILSLHEADAKNVPAANNVLDGFRDDEEQSNPSTIPSESLCLNISIKGMLLKSLHEDPQWGMKYLMADRCLRPEKNRHICLRGCYFHGPISPLKKLLKPAWEVFLVLDGLAGLV